MTEMAEYLDARDVRALLRLLGELRELGRSPTAWRAHLGATLEHTCGARVTVASELRVKEDIPEGLTNCGHVVTPLELVDHGLDAAVREQFYRDVYFTDHQTDDALEGIVPLYGTPFTVARADIIEDRRWNRSSCANDRFRKLGYDDFVMSMIPVPSLSVFSSLEVFRPQGKRFSPRDRLFLQLVHEELASDWNRKEAHLARLTPRQRQVLNHLIAGASEKELAYDLGVSAHTAHDHVKAIYRAFDVRSRGELLARATVQSPARTYLVAESQ